MGRWPLLLATLCLAATLRGAAGQFRKKPVLRDGLFKKFRFVPKREFWDEFRGGFDHDKWDNINRRWAGRQPGLFVARNVRQRKGMLLLKGRYENNAAVFADAPEGYANYTTAFVQSKRRARFGYYEVKAKPGNSRLSSSFWGSLDTPTLWTEIDVFELGGGAVINGTDFRPLINMNLHVFRDKRRGIEIGKNEIKRPSHYTHHAPLRRRFHVYGLDWARRRITWTFNGRPIRRDRNQYWKQAFPLKFDVETMPYWFGLPSRRTLPATYRIKYIRAWSRRRKRRGDAATQRLVSGDAFGALLGGGIVVPGLSTPRPDAGGDDDDGDVVEEEDGDVEDDEAIAEDLPDTGGETEAPRGGLQRPPTDPREHVYEPVPPPFGADWGGVIAAVNERADDVFGAVLSAGERMGESE